MMNQTTPQVNTMIVNEVRLSFSQFLPAMAYLRPTQLPAIPGAFLLREQPFKDAFASAKATKGTFRPPWRGGYGKLFWEKYIPPTARSNEAIWQAQLPFDYNFAQHIQSLSPGSPSIRTYLYPWGIGVILDIGFSGPMSWYDTIDRAFEIRSKGKIQWQFDTGSGNSSLKDFMGAILDRVSMAVYGAHPAEALSEIFSVVTVIDATGVSPAQPIPHDDEIYHIHRGLEALAGWNPLWKDMDLKPLSVGTMSIRQSPAGHTIYGKQQGRVVWFPRSFKSAGAKPTTLSCFHQNLTMASLHTSSLCLFAQDVAQLWNAKKSMASFSTMYRDCARSTAGLLGRLHGRKTDDDKAKKPEIYRSGSLRAQIQVYTDDINTARMALLKPPTKLDT